MDYPISKEEKAPHTSFVEHFEDGPQPAAHAAPADAPAVSTATERSPR